jgi:hypothetical protein
MGNGKRRLMGSFNSSTEAERFMNAWQVDKQYI